MKVLGKPLSTREWLFVIAIVVGAQFFIHSISGRFGGSANALGYVSFAGTVVSILLGLIAIIYSFVQSISQTSNVAEMSKQTELLTSAAREVLASKDMIHNSAVEIRSVTESLAGKLDDNTRELGSIRQGLSGFTLISPSSEMQNKGGGSVFDSPRGYVSIACLVVGKAIEMGWAWDEMQEKIIGPWCKKNGLTNDFGNGIFSAVLMALEAENLVDLEDDDNVVPSAREGFAEKYKELLQEARTELIGKESFSSCLELMDRFDKG